MEDWLNTVRSEHVATDTCWYNVPIPNSNDDILLVLTNSDVALDGALHSAQRSTKRIWDFPGKYVMGITCTSSRRQSSGYITKKDFATVLDMFTVSTAFKDPEHVADVLAREAEVVTDRWNSRNSPAARKGQRHAYNAVYTLGSRDWSKPYGGLDNGPTDERTELILEISSYQATRRRQSQPERVTIKNTDLYVSVKYRSTGLQINQQDQADVVTHQPGSKMVYLRHCLYMPVMDFLAMLKATPFKDCVAKASALCREYTLPAHLRASARAASPDASTQPQHPAQLAEGVLLARPALQRSVSVHPQNVGVRDKKIVRLSEPRAGDSQPQAKSPRREAAEGGPQTRRTYAQVAGTAAAASAGGAAASGGGAAENDGFGTGVQSGGETPPTPVDMYNDTEIIFKDLEDGKDE